jgi:hypothetical protein
MTELMALRIDRDAPTARVSVDAEGRLMILVLLRRVGETEKAAKVLVCAKGRRVDERP